MNYVNVVAAIHEPVAQNLKQNYELVDPDQPHLGYVREVLTPEEREAMKHHIFGPWRKDTQGANVFQVVEFYIPVQTVSDTDPHLVWVESMVAKWSEATYIVGVWNPDGTQYGQTLIPAVYDYSDPENPVEVTPEQVTGTPVYPVDARAKQHARDTNTGTKEAPVLVAATAPRDENLMLGWSPRRWT